MEKVPKYATGTGAGTWVATTITVAACPPLAGAFTLGFFCSFGIDFAVHIAKETYDYIDEKEFQTNMGRLEERFSLLKRLHGSILEVHVPRVSRNASLSRRTRSRGTVYR